MSPSPGVTASGFYNESICSKFRDPPLTSSTRRRLFPSRNTPLSSFHSLQLSSNRNPLPIEWHSPQDFGFDDHQDCLSDGGSSSSSGTVKISALSNLELPNTVLSPVFGDHGSTDVACPPCFLHPPYEDDGTDAHQTPQSTPNTVELAGQSREDATSSAPSSRTGKDTQRKVRMNSIADIYNFGHQAGFGARRSLPDLRTVADGSAQKAGNIRTAPLIAVDQTPLNDTVYRIDTWDTSVKLCTAIKLSEKGEIELHHHAQLSMMTFKQNISAKRISICLYVAHGVGRDRTCQLDRGQSSLFFENDSLLPPPHRPQAELNIIRDTCDAEEPLNVHISFTYSIATRDLISVLPTFRPADGTVLSESIFIGEPVPPLILKTLLKDQISTWKASQHTLGQVAHFERIKMPPLFPERLKDNLRIKVIRLCPARFLSVRDTSASGVVWDLGIKVQRILGLELECCMRLWLEIGSANTLLCMDPQGWTPKFFLIDDRLATEARGEWRQHGCHLVLFKQAHMLPGPVKIEMNWQEPAERDFMDSNCVYKMPLPRVVDFEVLGGSFTCNNVGAASLSNLGVKDHLFRCDEGAKIRLPVLRRGYTMFLTRMSIGSSPQLTSAAPNETSFELSSLTMIGDRSIFSDVESGPDLEPDFGKDCEQGQDKDREVPSNAHPSLLAMIIQAVIAWLTIFGLYFGAEHSRRRSERNEVAILENPSLPAMNRFGSLEKRKPDSGFNEPTRTGAAGCTFHGDDGESENWRDWVDTALGWKGYTP